MSKYKAYFNEYFLDKKPIQYLKENNTGEIGENECLFENFHENKEWFLYEGENNITAVFEDNSRQTFKVHFHENRGEDKHKHRTKAARTWKKLATEIRKNAGLNKVGNPIVIPWQECFQRALQDPLMKEFVDDLSATPIFENINEMSFNDLRQSMKKYKTRADINNGTKTGSRSRERGAKSVNTKSLRVISTVGKDNKERETSLFSYKSGGSSNRWQGFIRFLEGFDEGADGDVEVNCNCPDYRYVWAEPNADVGAGVTQKDGGFKAQAGFTGSGNENDPSKNQGIRNPNKTPGLCVAKGELISTNKGFIPIEKVNTSHKVWTLDGWKNVLGHVKTGEKCVIEIILASGKTIKLTEEHEVLSFNEQQGFVWKKAKVLSQNDFILSICPTEIDNNNSSLKILEYKGDKLYYPSQKISLDAILAELLGYMISEGSRGIFSNLNENLNKDFYSKWTKIFGKYSCILRKNGVYIGSYGDKILTDLGFIHGAYNKDVPEWIMKGNKKTVVAFLRGCYAGDGNFRNRHSTYASVSERLCRKIQLLLEFIGIKTNLKCYSSGINNSPTWVLRTSSQQETERLYTILMPLRGYSKYNISPSVQKHFSKNEYVIKYGNKFLNYILNETIYFNGEDKTILLSECNKYFQWYNCSYNDKLSNILRSLNKLIKIKTNSSGKLNNAAKLSDIFSVLKPLYIKKIKSQLSINTLKEYSVPQYKIRKIVNELKTLSPNTYLAISLLERMDISFQKVNNINKISTITEVYDLKIQDVEHFTVNGIIVHNCKHLITLADYLDTAAAKVAPAVPGKQEPSVVAPKTDKPKKPMNVFPSQPVSSTGEKPVNIFEAMKQFALQNPMFDVSYED